jgi:hypothetical protein
MILYHILWIITRFFAWRRFYSNPSRTWQISADLVGSGSKLNYRCFIVLLMFFFKKSFLVTQVSIHHGFRKSFARFYPDLGVVTPTVLAIIWNQHKKFKKNQKNTNPLRCVILCDLYDMKNNRLGILQTFWKKCSQKELPCTMFHGF